MTTDGYVDMINLGERLGAVAPVPPCPWWCTLDPGHPYLSSRPCWTDSEEMPGIPAGESRVAIDRTHEAPFGVAAVEQMERTCDGGQVVGLEPIVVIEIEVTQDKAADVRRIAADLLNAADLLDRIKSGHGAA